MMDFNAYIRFYLVIRESPVDALMKLLTILDSRLRENDMFFQSVTSLSVIPAKAGIQELIDNWSIVGKQKILFSKLKIKGIQYQESSVLSSMAMTTRSVISLMVSFESNA